MSHHPSSQLMLARSRQDDLLREAERHRLAATGRRERAGLRDRIAALLRRRESSPAEAPRVAQAAK